MASTGLHLIRKQFNKVTGYWVVPIIGHAPNRRDALSGPGITPALIQSNTTTDSVHTRGHRLGITVHLGTTVLNNNLLRRTFVFGMLFVTSLQVRCLTIMPSRSPAGSARRTAVPASTRTYGALEMGVDGPGIVLRARPDAKTVRRRISASCFFFFF